MPGMRCGKISRDSSPCWWLHILLTDVDLETERSWCLQPNEMNPKLLLSYACERTMLPGGFQTFRRFVTSVESQHLFIYMFWFIHCKFFQVRIRSAYYPAQFIPGQSSLAYHSLWSSRAESIVDSGRVFSIPVQYFSLVYSTLKCNSLALWSPQSYNWVLWCVSRKVQACSDHVVEGLLSLCPSCRRVQFRSCFFHSTTKSFMLPREVKHRG